MFVKTAANIGRNSEKHVKLTNVGLMITPMLVTIPSNRSVTLHLDTHRHTHVGCGQGNW